VNNVSLDTTYRVPVRFIRYDVYIDKAWSGTGLVRQWQTQCGPDDIEEQRAATDAIHGDDERIANGD